MGAYDVDLAATLEGLRTGLVAVVGEGRAHYDPSRVNIPGVWIDFKTIDVTTLAGVSVSVELVLAVPSSDPLVVADALSGLWNQVVELYGAPDGPVRTQTTLFPDSPAGRPSLVLPYLARI